MRSPNARRGFAAGRHPSIGTLAAGLALVWWLHGSPSASAGGVVVQCLERDDAGLLCADTDFNQCTVARCDSDGNCNQNADLLIGQPCQGSDDDNECTSAACVPCGLDESESACCYSGAILHIGEPCQDTDGNVCTIAGCREQFGPSAVCDQRFDVPEGEPCDDGDDDVCTFGFCREFIDLGGVCVSSEPNPCNDNNPCTFDHGCHPVLGCQHTTILCFDTDGNECTYPVCDPSTGDCDDRAGVRLGESCHDMDDNPCTVALCGDPCNGGDCDAPVTCDQVADCTDLTPPEATCPPAAVEVFCVDSTDIGDAPTFVDDCDLDLALDNAIEVTPTTDPDDPVLEVIEQTWVATNDCRLASECAQTITVLKPKFYLDIRPGSCPNVMDFRSRGTLRMSLVGTAEFDVTKVDVASLVLARADPIGGTIAPMAAVLQDTATPFGGDLCGCHRLGGDGIPDLTLKFNNLDVVTALQLNTVPPGATIRLVVSGSLSDGCGFTAADCMVRPAR